MRIDPVHDALLVVDVQHDFLPGGALAVADGDAVIAPATRLAPRFVTVVATQDFHPRGHVSFASTHGRAPYEVLELEHGQQELWPEHCVGGSRGAELHPEIPDHELSLILRKGTRPTVDSYSAFNENLDHAGRRLTTGLGAWLRARGIRRIFLCGLARDFCVKWSALDGVAEGFETWVVDDATRAVFPERNAEVDAELERAGVRKTESGELDGGRG
jgi:nicotinamidase/pyrazinamidase